VLKAVIHDWDDARGLIILRNCRRAVDPGRPHPAGRARRPEAIDTSERLADMAFSDLNMLVMVGGRERTEEEFRSLLAYGRLPPRPRHSDRDRALHPRSDTRTVITTWSYTRQEDHS
jgi:hypothetical protein